MVTGFRPHVDSGPPAVAEAEAQQARGDGSVSRSDVHKQREQNVWLKQAKVDPDRTMHATFRLPMPTAALRLTDLIELERQAGIAHAHRALGVSKTAVFVLNQIGLRRTQHSASSPNVASGAVTVRPERVARSLRSAHQSFTMTGAGLAATGSAHASFVPATVLHRLRAGERTAPRQAIRAGERFELRPDPADPVLNDHPSDHISAMAIIASTEDVLASLARGRLDELDAAFHAYADDSGAPLVLQVVEVGRGRFFATVQQHDRICAEISAFGAES